MSAERMRAVWARYLQAARWGLEDEMRAAAHEGAELLDDIAEGITEAVGELLAAQREGRDAQR